MSEPSTLSGAFDAGEAAFRAGKGAIENPYFADFAKVKAFDAWSDGWVTAMVGSLPAAQRREAFKTWRESHPHTFRGITASWAARR